MKRLNHQPEGYWHEFVFSKEKDKRLLRYSIFMFAWWIYFSFCDFLYQQPLKGANLSPMYVTTGEYTLIKTTMLILVYSIASYLFIYSILPGLIKGRWLKTTLKSFLLGISLFIAAYVLYWNIFPFIDSLFKPYKANQFVTWFWPAVYLGLINPTKVIATAVIIKYVKYLWLKQKESEMLEREIIDTELQLLKMQIQPAFLFNSLNSIYSYSKSSSPMASRMLLQLSDLLSYMLYECDQPFVPLRAEIEMMKEYMTMEKARLDKSFEMEINAAGDLNGKYIAPFLLLPLIEKSIEQSIIPEGHYWINLTIRVEDNNFNMTLVNGMNTEMGESQPSSDGTIEILQKRLNSLYPGIHQLKISSEQEMQIVQLKLQLMDSSVSPEYKERNDYEELRHEII